MMSEEKEREKTEREKRGKRGRGNANEKGKNDAKKTKKEIRILDDETLRLIDTQRLLFRGLSFSLFCIGVKNASLF